MFFKEIAESFHSDCTDFMTTLSRVFHGDFMTTLKVFHGDFMTTIKIVHG